MGENSLDRSVLERVSCILRAVTPWAGWTVALSFEMTQGWHDQWPHDFVSDPAVSESRDPKSQ